MLATIRTFHVTESKRMTKAAELLRESDLPLGAVAQRAGYHSEAAFSRAFKRHEGTAPATYRRQARA